MSLGLSSVCGGCDVAGCEVVGLVGEAVGGELAGWAAGDVEADRDVGRREQA